MISHIELKMKLFSQTANVLEMTPAATAIEEEVTTSLEETEVVTSEVASAASELITTQQHIISPRHKKGQYNSQIGTLKRWKLCFVNSASASYEQLTVAYKIYNYCN